MKKNQTILKTVFLLSLVVFLLQGCRNETVIDSTQDNFPQKYKISIINNNKILDNTEIVGEINKFKNKLKKSSRTVQDSVLEGAIIKTENILLIETENDKTYTLPIARTYETSKVENLVLKKKTDGKYSGVLIQYNLTPEEKIKYATGQYVDLKSKIKIFDIRKLNISARVQTDIVGCYEITWETGEPEFVCVHEPKCYGGATKPIDIFSISNICDSGGSSGDSGGNHSESGVPGGNDGGFSNGGGSGGSGLDPNDGTNIGNTSPLIIDEWRLFPRLDSEYQSKYNTLSHEIKLFISIQFANQLNLDFSKWSIDFFIQNPNTSLVQFQNWFMGESEGQDGEYDASFWDNPNLTFPQKSLPSWSDFYNAFPKNENNGYITFMSNHDVYKLVGGHPKVAHEAGLNNYQNACALRGSRALNYSKRPIEIVYQNGIQVTEKGGDNNNYILNAKAYNAYMNKTFPAPTFQLKNADNSALDYTKMTEFIKNKTGLYNIINKDATKAGYSGHVDMIINGQCLSGCDLNPKGGILKIEIWQLD